jgi:hypothetical protein
MCGSEWPLCWTLMGHAGPCSLSRSGVWSAVEPEVQAGQHVVNGACVCCLRTGCKLRLGVGNEGSA